MSSKRGLVRIADPFSGGHLSVERKYAVLHAVNVLKTLKLEKKLPRDVDVAKQVATEYACSIPFVKKLIKQARENDGVIPARKGKRARSALSDADVALLTTAVRNYALRDEQCSTAKLRGCLPADKQHVTNQTIAAALRSAGYRWGRVPDDSRKKDLDETYVVYQKEYAKRMLQHRVMINGGGSLRRPLIVLDESYVHRYHTHEETWLRDDMKFKNRTGGGQRLVIIGAIVYIPRHSGPDKGYIDAMWVPGSFRIWEVLTDRKKREANEAAYAGSLDDYHGNVKTKQFEDWFGEVCTTAQKEFGDCDIIMDCASYHRRRVGETAPTAASTKAVLQKFLDTHGIDYPPGAKKKRLHELVKANKHLHKQHFAVFDIAGRHHVEFTPQYLSRLQPIERVWAAIKNAIAREPPSANMTELKKKVMLYKDIMVTQRVCLSALQQAWSYEWELAEPEDHPDGCPLAVMRGYECPTDDAELDLVGPKE